MSEKFIPSAAILRTNFPSASIVMETQFIKCEIEKKMAEILTARNSDKPIHIDDIKPTIAKEHNYGSI